MGGDDGADPGPAPDASIELTPLDELGDGEPLMVPLTRPDGGGPTTRAEELDGPAVVNFFAEWCAPCVAEMPDFQEVSEEVAGQVEFVGVAVDRTDSAARIVSRPASPTRGSVTERATSPTRRGSRTCRRPCSS